MGILGQMGPYPSLWNMLNHTQRERLVGQPPLSTFLLWPSSNVLVMGTSARQMEQSDIIISKVLERHAYSAILRNISIK
jgi:hypothetical protein